MRILFLMEKRDNAGSIQAVTAYIRAAEECGHKIALYGTHDPAFPALRFSTDLEAFDYVVFIIEARLQWLSGLRLLRILDSVPRERRVVLDCDGVYSDTICVDAYDRNHTNESDEKNWRTSLDWLGGRIFQPTIGATHSGAGALPFYGYDSCSVGDQQCQPKRFDVMHVGHNWWRWRQMNDCLLPAIEQIRHQIGDVCFVGSWWDAVPPWARAVDLESALYVDPDLLRRLAIQVLPPVPYTQVIPLMSTAKVNVMSQRPLFQHLQILTSKYFEIFCADTVPLVMLSPDHAESVYGPAGRELALGATASDKLLDVLARPRKYTEVVEAVRQHLVTHHSYRQRVAQLVAALAA